MRHVTLVLLLALASAAARADTWSDLWATREQQAQQLLDSKRAAEAAPLFADPRRRAYAELQAGQYEKAAEHLAPFKDPQSQYNRGNALAHTGKLQDALAAYDAALKQSPGSRDVRLNRDLVAQALKQQSQGGQQGNPSQAENRTQPNSDGQSGSRAQQGNQSQAANPSRPDSQGKSGSQPPGGQAQAANQAQPSGQGGSGNQPQDGNRPQDGSRAQQATSSAAPGSPSANDPSNARAQSQPPSTNGATAAQRQPPQATGTGSAQEPQQAKSSAQAASPTNGPKQPDTPSQSLAAAGQRGDSRADALSARKALAGGADAQPQQPRSEQALALDQWLRGIPEDSGELLRRKFMIEHMMKQQGNEP
jgi:Ca-activated chloride channel homolog